MEQYFYHIKKPNKNIDFKIYIYQIGPYRYNWHKEIELMFVINGIIEICVEGTFKTLYENDFILINQNYGHATLAKTRDAKALVVHIDPIYFEEYLNDFKNYIFEGKTNSINRNDFKFIKLRSLLANFLNRLDKNDAVSKILVEGYISMISSSIIELFPPKKIEGDQNNNKGKQQNVLKKTIRYIEKRYNEKITLEEIAMRAGYNINYMSQYFKANMGISFSTYLTRIRLREATIDLYSEDLNISEIALKHGFPDVKAFNTSFKKSFGQTPSEYRKKVNKNPINKKIKIEREFIHLDDADIKQKLDNYRSFFSIDSHPNMENYQGNNESIDLNLISEYIEPDFNKLQALFEESIRTVELLKDKLNSN